MRNFLLVFLLPSACIHNLLFSQQSALASIPEECNIPPHSLITWLDNSISQSPLVEAMHLSCDDIAQISAYPLSQVVMTSGRKRGQYVVCLSNEADDPCKHVVAKLLGYEAPAIQLQTVFGLKEQKSEFLNETVERLYFKPSNLIR